jgi:prevent-host-death family protein
MKFISVRELRNRPGGVWKELGEGELVLTANGKPVGVLMGVPEGDLERTLAVLRRSRAALAVSRMREQAAEAGIDRLGKTEIESEIQAARRAGGGR